jgi:hypothetical protein
MTLLDEGVPRAWSWVPVYPKTPPTAWRGNQYRMVRPWLDHPPLYPLYVGAFMHAAGVRDIFAVELRTMRWSSLVLYVAAFFLFFACARRAADEPTALLALALWAVAAPAVWNGRLVMAEQLMLPLALGGYLALWRWRGSGRRRWLVALALLCALLPLCKASATALVLWLFTLAVLRRERAAALAVLVGGAAGLVVYAGYGLALDATLFVRVMKAQAGRLSNLGGMWPLLFRPRVVDQPIDYLPFMLGLFSLVWELREQRQMELALFAVIYAIGIAFFLPSNEYGWYAMPLYPVLAFGLATFLVRAWREAAPGAGWIWLAFVGTWVFWLLCDAGAGRPRLWRWVYLGAAVALPFAALMAARTPRRWRAVLACLVALQICADGWYASLA